MARLPDSSAELAEGRKTAVFILATGSFGFWFMGLVALLLSPRYRGSATGIELLVASAVAIATGIFLIVAIVAIFLNKTWFGPWGE